MANRFLALCIIFTVCVSSSFAQERKKIDRTTQQTETKPISSVSKSSSASSAKKATASSKPAQQSYFKISSQSAYFGADGGTQTFTVSSSGSWKIGVTTASWGHLARNGNTLTLRVDANTGASSRTDYFTITSGSKSIRVNISQSKGISLSVSSESLSFAASGGSQTLTVNASEAWKIGTQTNAWGHLSISGNQLTVRVDANASSASRTDYFTIKAGNLEKRISISQSAQSVSASSKTASSSTTKTSSSSATTLGSISAYPYYRYRRRKFNHAQDYFCGGFSVGYIQKQWTIEENGEKEKCGLFDDDKYIQGVQAGFRIDPQFGAGFGINSGLFYEYCWAKSDDEYSSYGTYHTTYEEHGLYLPTHLKFTMNFSEWFQLSFYGGTGFYYALSGKAYLRSDGETYDSEDVFAEEENWKKFNMMLEYGLSIRIKALQIDITQSQGLNNWSDTDGLKVKQGRPLSVSATICF